MSIITAYCPNCEKEVLMAREDINWGLAIFLLIFTGGIGLLIYVVIYVGQDETHCVHCQTICIPVKTTTATQLTTRKVISLIPQRNLANVSDAKFCPYCGVKLGEREGISFCALCGAKIS